MIQQGQGIAPTLQRQTPEPAEKTPKAELPGQTEGLARIKEILTNTWVGPLDEMEIEQIWGSFGDAILQIASEEENYSLWRQSIDRGAELDDLPAVRNAQGKFTRDIITTASGYLTQNRAIVVHEMERLGIPSEAKGPSPEVKPEATSEQREEVEKLQMAAEKVAKLQKAQEHARNAWVGYNVETWIYNGEPHPRWSPVRFSPFSRPEATDPVSTPMMPVDTVEINSYDEIKKQYDLASQLIDSYVRLYPMIYAISRGGKSETTADFASQESPEKAREELAAAIGKLLADIDGTQNKLGGDLNPLDLTPIHDQLLSGATASSQGVNWKLRVPNDLARDLVKDHNFGEAMKDAGLEGAAMLLFILAPFTGGFSLYVAMAGLTVTSAKALRSAEQYAKISEASRTSVTPGTELVSKGQVEEAEMAAKADLVALTLATLIVGASAVGSMASIRGPKPISERVPLIGKKMGSAGYKGSSTVEGCGVYRSRIPGIDKDVAIKIYPKNHPNFMNDLNGARAAEKTGMGPKVYGEVNVGPDKQGFAMDIVEGGFADATGGASAAETAEANFNASKVTMQTVADIEEYSRRLLSQGNCYLGDLQGLVDEAGRWRPIDFAPIRKLPPPTDTAAYEEALRMHGSTFEREVSFFKKQAAENAARK
ncbi:MAG: hypothetical protein V2B20_23610 [Pseudomonadota bacterium]